MHAAGTTLKDGWMVSAVCKVNTKLAFLLHYVESGAFDSPTVWPINHHVLIAICVHMATKT